MQSPCQSPTLNKFQDFSDLESLNFQWPCKLQGTVCSGGFYALTGSGVFNGKIKRSHEVLFRKPAIISWQNAAQC
jgi:hypothetical protein